MLTKRHLLDLAAILMAALAVAYALSAVGASRLIL